MSTIELSSAQASHSVEDRAARRVLDMTLAVIALVLLFPVMALAALAVLIQGGRPILFSQVRLGQGGQPFLMYKFRKFGRDCGTSGCPLTLQGDPRMTSVGRILQATKLDELPQLWNVIRGDMSLVGPRPESLAFADCFTNGYERILDHKPGVIGPSQVLFRNESCFYPKNITPDGFYRQVLFPTKARIDLAYFGRRTLLGDLIWLARGVLAVLGWTPAGAAPLGEGAIPAAVPADVILSPALSAARSAKSDR